MSSLLSKVLLAMLMMPAAGVICLSMHIVVAKFRIRNHSTVWQLDGLAVFLFVIAYWSLLWFRSIRWSSRRIWVTLAAAPLAWGICLGVVTVLNPTRVWEAPWLFGAFPQLLWLITTVWIWRETPAERSERLRAKKIGAISCPSCGYNLTGLMGTRCPECGTQYPLDELIASQPARADEDVSG
jgi:dolichyl-phosphate-mannose--protein O-mannosyl transferase